LWLHRWIEGYTTAPIYVNRFLLRLTVSAVRNGGLLLYPWEIRVHVDDASVHTGERQLKCLGVYCVATGILGNEEAPTDRAAIC